MRALDLFCGAAGGWTKGLHAAGFETLAACEIDKVRRALFSRNWPSVKMYADIKELTGERVERDVGDIDIVVGSPPCQDASSANAKGKGVDGERTGLFFEALRLVREVRPRWVCLENVPGLKPRGYDRVHDELEAAGYEVRPLVVGAWHAGAPHRRNRVWIIANAKEVGRRERIAQDDAWQSNAARGGADDANADQEGQYGIALDGEVGGRLWQPPADTESERCGPGRARRSDSSDARQPEQAFLDAHTPLLQRPSLAGDQSDVPDALHEHCRDFSVCFDPNRCDGNNCWLKRNPEFAPDALGVGSQARPGPNKPLPELALANWSDWNGGPPDLGRVDDGLPKGMARVLLSAYGDAVVPIIPELIGRIILQLDRAAGL